MSDLFYKLRLILAYRDAITTRVPFLFNKRIRRFRKMGEEAACQLKEKKVIDVAFLLTIPGMWKLDYVYQIFKNDKRFHPYIVIYPYSNFKSFAKEELWKTVHRTEDFVQSRGYEYIIPYNAETKKWDDIHKTLNPDIVFFTTPYRDILPQYYIYNFADKLTFYVPYSFQAMKAYKLDYGQISFSLFTSIFVETPLHMEDAYKYDRWGGKNYILTGYPGTEVFLHKDYKAKDVWKPQECLKKRVIWAPHHTIDTGGEFHSSTFLDVCDIMLTLAEKYKDTIQFAFKPHQLLKFKLIQLWGQERTDNYYRQWDQMPNTQLEETEYRDLFMTSDAMVHDSAGFTIEYLFVNKPVMYLIKDHQSPEQLFNAFGAKAFQQHYHANSVEDVEEFLDDVVLNGNDAMQANREKFYHDYLAPIGGKMPSENIVEYIKNLIK